MKHSLGTVTGLIALAVFAAQALAQQQFTTTVDVPLQQHPSVSGVWIDPAGLGEDGQAPAIRSLRVREADQADAKPLPARMDEINHAYRILWRVPGVSKGQKAGQAQAFTIELNPDQASPKLNEDGPNLVYNGGFETLDAKGRPEAMGISAKRFDEGFRIETDAGNRFLSFNTPPKGGHGPIYLSPWVAVAPGKAYICSFRYNVKNASRGHYNLSLTSLLQFQDAEGKTLPFVRALYLKDMDTDGWKTYQVTIAAPGNATKMSWQVRNRSATPWSVRFDDLRIAPADLPTVSELKTASGQDIALTAQSPDIRRFDLGPAKSPVWTGFTALTPENKYSKQKGFGFTRLSVADARNTTRPDALRGDYISARDARLRIDLPAGDYQVWLLRGDSQVGSTTERFYFERSFKLNGKEQIQPGASPMELFNAGGDYWRYYKDFWTPGMDYYDTFVAPHFKVESFKATVAKDRLDIDWTNVPVDAIVIAPADQADAMTREMNALQGQLRRATQITEVPGPTEPMPALSDVDQQRGYVLFRRPASDVIYPSSRPKQGEEIDHLQTFAAPGQGESIRFSLLPVKDLGDISVQATDLSDGSSTIAASAIEIRVERYSFHAVPRTKHVLYADYHYQIAPFAIQERASVPGQKGVTWTWWATIRVPEKTPAGVYTGSLRITPQQGQAFDLPLRVRVLPFKLAPLPIVQGYYYNPSEPWYSAFWTANVHAPVGNYVNTPDIHKLIAQNEMREFAFMKDLGLNSASMGDDLRGDWVFKDGEVTLKPDNRFVFWMDLYAKAGMGPIPYYGFQPLARSNRLASWFGLKQQFSPAWDKAYRSIAVHIHQLAQQHHWPEVIFYVTDEAANIGQPGADIEVKAAKVLKDIPGLRTISSMNGPVEQIAPPYLSISMPNVAFPITEKTIQLIHDAGSELWIYNTGSDRLMLGLYPWRIGAKGRFQWHYRSMCANPWDDLDGTYGESQYSISLPGPDGPVGTDRSEAARAAINDHRYMTTLQNAIDKAADQPDKKEVVAQAKQFLADLHRRIPIDARALMGRVDARETGEPIGGEFKNSDALDRVRWAAAEYILKLQGR